MKFEDAFAALTGHAPMRWQSRLFGRLIEGRTPDALDLPTGLGKTSVIAIWLIARALGAPLPRRLVYVVDRRAVVDQATEVAGAIAAKLGEGSSTEPTVLALREGLGLRAGRALPVSTLRGQYVDNRAWLEDPAATSIVVGTVDMIGSRLLFEGYGVSSRMRPVHAGLLGADVLAVIDEAHLVPPFEALLRSIAALPLNAPVPAFRLLTLSATGRTDSGDVFRLDEADEHDPRAAGRLSATKRLAIEPVRSDLAVELAERAFERGAGGQRVIIFCNSRKMAQRVSDHLAKRLREQHGRNVALPALLVGARRVREREGLKEDPVFRRFMPGTPPPVDAPEAPAFLVATSAGEVGVDLDADHLVCDLVPWERMVQRFGRVNRRPKPGRSSIDILVDEPADDAESTSAAGVAVWRAPFESGRWSRGEDGRRDASPIALMRMKADADLSAITAAASTPEPLRPLLSGPLLDAWAMTSLEEHHGRPDIEPWLRGWREEEPQTRVAWRRLLPIRGARDEQSDTMRDLASFFASGGPHLSEILEAPSFQVAEMLKKRCAAWLKTELPSDGLEPWMSEMPRVIVLDARDRPERTFDPEDIASGKADFLVRALAGRTAIVDARLGGLAETGLLDDKAKDPPTTLDGGDPSWADLAGFRIRSCAAVDPPSDPDWFVEHRWSIDPDADAGDRRELRVEVRRRDAATRGDPAIARFLQALDEHHARTAGEAGELARRLRLPADLEAALVAAAAIHDAGKARELWQNAMAAPLDGRPYAKTKGGANPRALEIAGETYRHEFGSLIDAERDPTLAALPSHLHELALHLVAAHHGYARPTIAAVDPAQPPSVSMERARTVAMRFARLQREWGPWGLAWCEALLRAADWAASRAINEGGDR